MSDNYHAVILHASAFGVRADMGRTALPTCSAMRPTCVRQSRIERSMDHGHGVLDYQGAGLRGRIRRIPGLPGRRCKSPREERARERPDRHPVIFGRTDSHTNYCHYRVVKPLAVDTLRSIPAVQS